MSSQVKPIPEGFHSITPGLIVNGAQKAIEFYKEAFGAEVLGVMTTPDGSRVAHSEIKIGNSILFVNDEFPDMKSRGPLSLGGTPVSLSIYVEDADAAFAKATAAGATVVMPLADQFWGDRWGMVTDPFGHIWSIATHIADPTHEEVVKASKEFFSSHGEQAQAADS